jgi:hypothetical protein
MNSVPVASFTPLLILGLALSAHAQPPPPGTSRHYVLPATPATVQWGWYDTSEPPKLTIHSGDTVSIETLSHSLGQIKPGVDMDQIIKLRKENDGGGPHSITGPIYVEEAEPGDTLEIHILKIVPKFQSARHGVSRDRTARVGVSRGICPLLQARPCQDADAIQARRHDRSEALSGDVHGRRRSARTGCESRAADP